MTSSVKFSISNSQHGFRQKRSTVTNLIEYLHEVNIYYDNTETNYLACLFLDFQKAFVKLNYATTINKVRSFGFTGQCSKLLKNYLTDRKQTVRIGQAGSSIPVPIPGGQFQFLVIQFQFQFLERLIFNSNSNSWLFSVATLFILNKNF